MGKMQASTGALNKEIYYFKMLFGIQIISKIERAELRYKKLQIMAIYSFRIEIWVNSSGTEMI